MTKKIMGIVIGTIFIIVPVFLILNVITKGENRQVDVGAISEEIKEVSQYTAYEFHYTSVIHYSDSNTFQGITIPFTGNNFIATIDGKMGIGINADLIDITEAKNSDGKVSQVVLTVPHSEIQDNHTIQSSLEIYDEKDNIFNLFGFNSPQLCCVTN